jgi:DNA modification methylase
LTDLYLTNQKINLESGGENILLIDKMIENYINKVINGDCIKVMGEIPENSVDLVVSSPPYNVGITYDTHIDNTNMEDYWTWTKDWLTEAYRLLKDDGRVAINIPYEVNVQDRGGRVFFVSEFYQVMKQIGFKFFGIVDLEEDSPHRSKTTAWGSWMSPSSPYIYNPKECVILAYKKHHIKKVKGQPEWTGELTEIENEDGTKRNKMIHTFYYCSIHFHYKQFSFISTSEFPPSFQFNSRRVLFKLQSLSSIKEKTRRIQSLSNYPKTAMKRHGRRVVYT